MPIHVKSHRRGKSIVKAYTRQGKLLDLMRKIDRRLTKQPSIARRSQMLNLKTRVRSELNVYARNAQMRAIQIQSFRETALRDN